MFLGSDDLITLPCQEPIEYRNPQGDVLGVCNFTSLVDVPVPLVSDDERWFYSHPYDGSEMDGDHPMPYGVQFNSGNWLVCLPSE